MQKLVLIDGNSLINRAFYAMPLLSSKDGVYTNAVYGFMNMFFKMLSDEKPTHVAVAFDVHAKTFRHELFSEYKGTRKPSPPELPPQIELLRSLLNDMGVKTYAKAGIEADDIIGTLCKATDVKTVILTGDKDSFQLVDSSTEVHFTKRGITDVEVYNHKNFLEKVGYTPKQVIEYKALRGDTSDNIPGVSGIGEKTATELVVEYGDIDNLYANLDNIKGKLKEKLELGKDSAYFSRTLATIKTDCDIDTSLQVMALNLPFSNTAKKRFIELGFKSVQKSEYFSEEQVVKTVEVIEVENLEELNGKTALSVYDGTDKISMFDGEKEYKITLRRTLLDDGFAPADAYNAINNCLKEKTVIYDVKSFMHKIKDIGREVRFIYEDLSVLKYLVDFSGGAEKLEDVISSYSKSLETPAFSIHQIFIELKEKLGEEESLYYDVELPLIEVLFSMESVGFKVDYDALTLQGDEFRKQLNELEKSIKEMTGEPTLNVNSPKQLGEVLFEKMKIGKGKKTKTGYSTSQDVLSELEDGNPVISLILKYRSIQKLLSTYIEGFKPLINKTTGIINTSFNQTVTATGRLSSKEPNLQNIPVRDELGRNLRKFFASRHDGGMLVSADYSQIELRLLADFSNTKSLIDAFKEEKDIHTATASKVFGVMEKDVTADMRRKAKAVNFGVIYGISEYGLAKNVGCSPREAKEFIDAYFKEYPEVKKYMENAVLSARKTGYAQTLLKRKRYIREINSPNFGLRSFGERAAMNMPLQGSAADVIKLAMLKVYNRLKKENLKSKLILQIHDELIIDAVKEERELVQKILKEEMESAVHLKVKLTAVTGYGKTWYDAK